MAKGPGGRPRKGGRNNDATTPIGFLRELIADSQAATRERMQAASQVLRHQHRQRQAKKPSEAEAARAALDELGWFTDWHIGWNGRCPTWHPHFGVNLLKCEENRRHPVTGQDLGPVPDWYRRLQLPMPRPPDWPGDDAIFAEKEMAWWLRWPPPEWGSWRPPDGPLRVPGERHDGHREVDDE